MSVTRMAAWNAGALQDAAAVRRRTVRILAAASLRSHIRPGGRTQHTLIIRAAVRALQAKSC